MQFASANPSVVRSIKQRELLNAWLRARATPRPRALPHVRDYQPDRFADEMTDMMGFDVAVSGNAARFFITQEGATLAVTHASVVRAAIVHALGADPYAFWRIDVAPLSLARLSGRDGRWNLVALGPLGALS